MFKHLLLPLSCCFVMSSCVEDDYVNPTIYSFSSDTANYVFLLEEGNWQSDNGQMSLITPNGIVNHWFSTNTGFKIGDTPEDILYVPSRNILVITVNWSNIVYFITPTGELLAQTENVPNCRHIATDGDYVYVTSYAHTTALGEVYTKGYVAKISLDDFQVKSTCEVGYEPEGIAYYNGSLFIANTGGYAFSENHDYEHHLSQVDAETMSEVDTFNIVNSKGEFVINLYGELSQSGEFICFNSPGDYYDVEPSIVIFNCETKEYTVYEEIPATYNTTLVSGNFFVIGSYFTYNTGSYVYCVATINPKTQECVKGMYELPSGDYTAICDSLVNIMTNPYCAYQNPYTGHLFMTDATSFASPGRVYEIDDKGNLVYLNDKKLSYRSCYINPGHMVAVPSTAIN